MIWKELFFAGIECDGVSNILFIVYNSVNLSRSHTFCSSIYKCFELSLSGYFRCPVFIGQVFNRVHQDLSVIDMLASTEIKERNLLISLGITKTFFNCSYVLLYFLFNLDLISMHLCQEPESLSVHWWCNYFGLSIGSRHLVWRSKACAWLILLSSLWMSWVESSPFEAHFIDDNSYFWRGAGIDHLIRYLSLVWILKSEQAHPLFCPSEIL